MTVEEEVRTLFLEIYTPLFKHLSSWMQPQALEDVEDVIQQTFLEFYREKRKGKTFDRPRGWIFVTARNISLDYLKRRRKGLLHGETIARPASELNQTPETELLQREQLDAVAASIAALPPQERACLRLRARGFSYREIAEVLGIEVNTVGPTLAHALKKVKRNR